MVSAEHVGGTRGSGTVSSAAGVRGIEELVEWVKCACVWLGATLNEKG